MPATLVTPDSIPVANPRAIPLITGRVGEVPVLDFDARTLHFVNPTAAAVLLSCDGSLSVDQIAVELGEIYDTEPGALVDDVASGLDGLRDVGLVRTAGDGEFLPSKMPPLVSGATSRYPAVIPCSCGTGINEMPWEPTLSVAVGDLRIGIRTDSAATDSAVRAILAPVIDGAVAPDDAAPPKYSVALLADELSGMRPPVRSGLFEDQRWLVSSPDHQWLLRWLRQRVAGWRPLGSTEVRLSAVAIVGPAGATVVPWALGSEAPYVRLADEKGLALVPSPIFIDVATNTICGVGSPAAGVVVRGVVQVGSTTTRLEPDQALLPLLAMADLRVGDDVNQVADGLDAVARSISVVEAAATDVFTVAAALASRRS